jgi:hypothetical protein
MRSAASKGSTVRGARYLVAGHRTTDHARLVTLAAYKTYDEETQNAWRGSAPTDAAPTRDTVEAAYANYDREMSGAWRGAQ